MRKEAEKELTNMTQKQNKIFKLTKFMKKKGRILKRVKTESYVLVKKKHNMEKSHGGDHE